MGQKRRWNADFKMTLKEFDNCNVFIDLFGGSGLLSQMVRQERPYAYVVYNDFDDYHVRIANVARTNALLSEIRKMTDGLPKDKPIKGETRNRILNRLKEEEKTGYVDYITLSSSLLFSMNYAQSHEEMTKKTIYNHVRQTDYSAEGYLKGIDVVKCDYKELFSKWRKYSNVCFLIDPPYLSTEAGSYKGYWKLKDYLDVLHTLKETNYFYFTSNKSNIEELCEWMERNYAANNPFHGAKKIEIKSTTGYNSSNNTDIMLYKKNLTNAV